MAIALRHPIAAKVDDRADFLRILLNEYPTFLTDWENKTMTEFSQIAKEDSGGDKEIENDLFHSLCSAFGSDDDKMNMFYQSIFLMSYSYYESCVAKLCKEAKTKEKIKAICKSRNILLSEEASRAIDYLQNDINDLRNNICHNNFGTYRKSSVLKDLSKKNIGIRYDSESNELIFFDSKFIEDVLNKMHMVLHELCEKLGYKTKIYPNDFKS